MNPSIHHHEVGNDQCEIGFQYSTLTQAADKLQIAKHIIKNVAFKNNKIATFMPKPFKNDAGSGMHCHISLFDEVNKLNLFHGDKYHNLSETALFFIGGVAKHIGAICAFTNPTTNSYKRLKPGFEAPVIMSYSRKNRSTAVRIPYSNAESKNETRIECRFPDPSANPYLAFSAILMAGLDGILNKIHPGEATDFNLYSVEKEDMKNFKFLPHSLCGALHSLEEDNEFLKFGNVFSDKVIESFLKLKYAELQEISNYPTPAEFEHYLNC
jgi:glutamine synthetase